MLVFETRLFWTLVASRLFGCFGFRSSRMVRPLILFFTCDIAPVEKEEDQGQVGPLWKTMSRLSKDWMVELYDCGDYTRLIHLNHRRLPLFKRRVTYRVRLVEITLWEFGEFESNTPLNIFSPTTSHLSLYSWQLPRRGQFGSSSRAKLTRASNSNPNNTWHKAQTSLNVNPSMNSSPKAKFTKLSKTTNEFRYPEQTSLGCGWL